MEKRWLKTLKESWALNKTDLRSDDFEMYNDIFDVAVNVLLHARSSRRHPTAQRWKLHRIGLVTWKESGFEFYLHNGCRLWARRMVRCMTKRRMARSMAGHMGRHMARCMTRCMATEAMILQWEGQPKLLATLPAAHMINTTRASKVVVNNLSQ